MSDKAIIPRLLLNDLVEFVILLRGEWSWKEPTGDSRNGKDYRVLSALIDDAVRWRNSKALLCDTCGTIHADDSQADEESCECGRFKQRMPFAVVVSDEIAQEQKS